MPQIFHVADNMCRTHQHISNSGSWNWNGSIIEPETSLKRCRKVTGTNTFYNVDIREFLTSTDNRIIRKKLEEISNKLPPAHKDKFLSRKEGSFDFRVDVIKEYVSKHIEYFRSSHQFDAWLFPQETITLRKGDCEDRAFLIASMMLASGISKYVVRVAFGRVRESTGQDSDHVWVMYHNEKGVWQLIEPMSYCPPSSETESTVNNKTSVSKSYLYTPYYVMNPDHLWKVYSQAASGSFPDYINHRSFWEGFHPEFGYKAHKEIVNRAIVSEDFKSFLREKDIKNQLLTLGSFESTIPSDCLNQFAYQVSNVDISLVYEPRLHFDNGLINESFVMMENNLKTKTLRGLAKVLHAVGDIYAHTSFSAFTNQDQDNEIPEIFKIYDERDPGYLKQFSASPDYSKGIFDLNNFSNNSHLYKNSDHKKRAIDFWKNKIISGRFGQSHDSQNFLEYTQFWPEDLVEKSVQGALPHHNEIAVDTPVFNPEKHTLYKNEQNYRKSYDLRKQAAIQHISNKYAEWKSLF
jgi:hypothetical protein